MQVIQRQNTRTGVERVANAGAGRMAAAPSAAPPNASNLRRLASNLSMIIRSTVNESLYTFSALRDAEPQHAIARHSRDAARQKRAFALTAPRIERNDMYMHFWRTKGTLPGIIANVKAASPQENRALQRSSALFYPVLGQQNPLNYFIYLINCSAFVRICALDRAVIS